MAISARCTSKTAALSAVRVNAQRFVRELRERLLRGFLELRIRRQPAEIIAHAGDAAKHASNRRSRERMHVRLLHPVHEASERAGRRPGLRAEKLHALERLAQARPARIDAAH